MLTFLCWVGAIFVTPAALFSLYATFETARDSMSQYFNRTQELDRWYLIDAWQTVGILFGLALVFCLIDFLCIAYLIGD